jgi:hypothetical protein
MNDIKLLLCLLLLSGCLLHAAETPKPPTPVAKPDELARFEGVWSGEWDGKWPVEFTLEHESGNQFKIVYRYKERLTDPKMTEYRSHATYNPQTKQLNYGKIEFTWHRDGKRLVAKGTFPKATRLAVLIKKDKPTAGGKEEEGKPVSTP